MTHLCYLDWDAGHVIWDDDGAEQFIGNGWRALTRFLYWAATNGVKVYLRSEDDK